MTQQVTHEQVAGWQAMAATCQPDEWWINAVIAVPALCDALTAAWADVERRAARVAELERLQQQVAALTQCVAEARRELAVVEQDRDSWRETALTAHP